MMTNHPAHRGAARAARILRLAMLVAAALVGRYALADTVGDTPPKTPADEFAALTALADTAAARLERLHQRQAALREKLTPIPAASRNEVRAAQKKNKQLARAVAGTESAFARLAPAHGAATSLAELKKAARAAQARTDDLVRQQAEAAAASTNAASSSGLPTESPPGDMKAITIKLVKNRVVPLTAKFFSARAARARLSSGEVVSVRVVSRIRDGEAVADALRPGGLVDSLLGKHEPGKNYVRLLVCADSIAAYRLLASHVARKGFAYGWDTTKDQDHIQRVGGPESPGDARIGVYRTPG